MKMKIVFASALMFLTVNGFSQATKIKQEHKKQASNNHPTAISNSTIQQKATNKMAPLKKKALYDSLVIKTNPKNIIPLNTKPKGIKKNK